MSNLMKHSATIQLAGSLTLGQRQTYNALLKNALPWMERGEDHWILTRDLEAILGKSGSRNRRWLLETAISLRRLDVVYNVFGKDQENAEIWQVNSGLLAEVVTKRDGELINYSFPNTLVDLLRNPAMFAKINLDFQTRFRGHYGLPLYEFYLDILGGKRNEVTYVFPVAQLRRLLCLEGKHVEFKRLNSKVIQPAHREINEHTDINVEVVEHRRENRSVTALTLHIVRTGSAAAANANILGQAPADLQCALELYYDRSTIVQILNRYSADYLRAQIEYFERQRAARDIRNPSGYLRACIQTNYADFRKESRNDPVTKGNAGATEAGPDAGVSQEPDNTLEVYVEEAARKAARQRWREHCERAVEARFAACSAEEQEELRSNFEASELYSQSKDIYRSRKGIYRRMFNAYLLNALCPEAHFHDLEAFIAWEQGESGTSDDGA